MSLGLAVPHPNILFYALAMAVQLALAATIVVRQWRREWAWVVAALFVANAGLALAYLLVLTGQSGFAYQAMPYFDHVCFVLLAYLALAFPSRPRLLQGRPWLLPALLGSLLAALLAIDALPYDGLTAPRSPWSPLTVPRLLAGFVLPGLAWSVLLGRWAYAWPRTTSPFLRQQFQFVFAAFGMRAANQLIVTLPVHGHVGSSAAAFVVAYAANIVPLAVLFAAIGVLVRTQSRQAGLPRRQTHFVLAFLLLGLTQGFFTASAGGFPRFYEMVLIHFDLFVVRPALLWFAMVRHDFLGARWPHGVGLALMWTLGLGAATAILHSVLATLVPRPVEVSLLLAVVAATLVVVVLRPWLVRPAPEEGGDTTRAQTYLAAVEDAYRNGPPGPADAARLEEVRAQLGLTAGQHDALMEAVRMRWVAHGQAWGRGQTVLGRYRVEQALGQGSAGEVHLAVDLLDRSQVVLKRTHALGATDRRALLREAEALARLHHPRIVRLVRTETHGDEPVLVLEPMAGSLQGLLARGPLPPERAVRIALDVLEALAAIHDEGIVHRDVKPANILLDAHGRAKLADFSVSRDVRAPLLGDPTLPGSQPGSLRYMAPEQVQGGLVDARTDLYALAVVLHEMLSGHHPLGTGLAEYATAKAVLEQEAPPLPESVPDPLRAVVARALEKRPQRRYASAAAFAAALSRAGTPASSAPPRPHPPRPAAAGRRAPAAAS